MSSFPGVFQLCSFLGIVPSESSCIFAFEPSSCPCNSFPRCLSIWLFCYDLFVPIFYTKIVLLHWHPAVGISSYIFPLLSGMIFFVILECPVLIIIVIIVNNAWKNKYSRFERLSKYTSEKSQQFITSLEWSKLLQIKEKCFIENLSLHWIELKLYTQRQKQTHITCIYTHKHSEKKIKSSCQLNSKFVAHTQ